MILITSSCKDDFVQGLNILCCYHYGCVTTLQRCIARHMVSSRLLLSVKVIWLGSTAICRLKNRHMFAASTFHSVARYKQPRHVFSYTKKLDFLADGARSYNGLFQCFPIPKLVIVLTQPWLLQPYSSAVWWAKDTTYRHFLFPYCCM